MELIYSLGMITITGVIGVALSLGAIMVVKVIGRVIEGIKSL
jgi:hypothetical protein